MSKPQTLGRFAPSFAGKPTPYDEAHKLVRDLWHFIENVTDDDPARNEKFFALRERVRSL